ncbi:MAG: putative sugar O-methyltransferase [Proteobacteria bacterium]|nr:putative sugar O-methyltransferase [Pseudomonadota bacterium]
MFFRKKSLQSNQPDAAARAVHTLAENHNLTPAQHARCATWADRLQQLYDGADAYCARHGIDPALAFPDNEWRDIVPRTGATFRKTYNDINYLRLNAPFAGYHLPILDRLDVRSFPDDFGAGLVTRLGRDGIPDGIAAELDRLYAARDRLSPLVPEYLEFVRNVPPRYHVRTPRMLGEIGIEVDGVLVNADVILCQSRINAMLSGGVLDKLERDIARHGRARVVEVGSGWGALGYALRAILGDRLEYVAIDLPTSLYCAALYLGVTHDWQNSHLLLPDDPVPDSFEFLFVANYMMEEVADRIGPVDLALNCMSFPEMSAAQVRSYGVFFQRVLRVDGVVFDENAAIKPHHTDSKAILGSLFPFRRPVSAGLIKTKNDCQDIWASRYLGEIFDRSDAMYLRR